MGPEVWRPIPGREPFEASSWGRIRNASTGCVRKPSLSPQGYEVLRLTNQGKPISVHRLVAWTFIGPQPDGLQVNHIDGVKRNNRPENLEYVTARENLAHAWRLGLSRPVNEIDHDVPRGEEHSRAKLTAEVVSVARARYVDEHLTLGMLARECGVSEASMRNAVRGKTWAHIPGAVPSPLKKRHRQRAA